MLFSGCYSGKPISEHCSTNAADSLSAASPCSCMKLGRQVADLLILSEAVIFRDEKHFLTQQDWSLCHRLGHSVPV